MQFLEMMAKDGTIDPLYNERDDYQRTKETIIRDKYVLMFEVDASIRENVQEKELFLGSTVWDSSVPPDYTVPHEKPCTSLKDFNYKFNEEDVLVNASTGVVQPAARALYSAATLTCFPELPRHAFQVHRSTLCRSATTRHSAT